MDKTPRYILMCEKAKEIQQLRKHTDNWQVGDFYKVFNHFHEFTILCYTENQKRTYHGSNQYDSAVWLPHQDHLQEMWWNKNSALHPKDLFHMFSNTLQIHADYFYLFLSPEQLWLAFVMGERYGKTWNETKKEWVR